jgi:predicted deacylase
MPKRNPPFVLGGQTIEPGTRVRVPIPVAPLYVQMMVHIDPVVVHGTRPGPALWLSAGIHGDELNGIWVVRQVLEAVEPEALSGTLVAVPIVNAFGLLQQSRYLPDRRDLNRSFPGTRKGSLASRLARLFMKEIVARCTHGIDLHTGAVHHDNLPQIRANLDDSETRRLARAFGARVMIHANMRDGSLRQAAMNKGVVSLLYEAGEALRLSRKSVRIGTAGVLRVMSALGMLSASSVASRLGHARSTRRVRESRDTTWVRASKSGFLLLDVELGDRVKKGQVLGALHFRVHRDFFPETHRLMRAPHSGIVIGVTRNPLINLGDALVHIAALLPRESS